MRKKRIIQKITFNFKHTVTIVREDNPIPNQEGPMIIRWDNKEKIVIDRQTEVVTISRKMAEECGLTLKYHSAEAVSDFLDRFDAKTLFAMDADFKAADDGDSQDIRKYKVTVLFDDGSERKVSGHFNETELPKDYPQFIDSLTEFLNFYGVLGEMFSTKLYVPQAVESDEDDGLIVIQDGTVLPNAVGEALQTLADAFYGLEMEQEYEVDDVYFTFKFDGKWYVLTPDTLGTTKYIMDVKSRIIEKALRDLGADKVKYHGHLD